MSLRKRMQELAIEQEAMAEMSAEETAGGDEVVEVADAVEDVEQVNQEVETDLNAADEATEIEGEIEEQVETNNEMIEAEAEPTDAQVVAAEMHLKHFAYRFGMVDSIATESVDFGGAVGELAFESYSYTSLTNKEKLRNVNLALEGFKEKLANAKTSIVETIKKWIEAIKHFFKSIFSGTYRAYNYVKKNAGALKDAISKADTKSEDYKVFMEKYSKSAAKMAKSLGIVDKEKAKTIKAGSTTAIVLAGNIADLAIKNIEELKKEVQAIKDDKEAGFFKQKTAEIAARWKHEAVTVPELKDLKPTDIAASIDGLVSGYEKISGGVANKIVAGASFICEKVQAGLGKVGSEDSKAKNELNRQIFAAARQYTNAISVSSTAINSALVAIAKYGKKLNIKPEEAKQAETAAAGSENKEAPAN